MLDCQAFGRALEKHGVTFFAGVPDSLLKDFCNYLIDTKQALIVANEGNAVGTALGYHLATGRTPVCFMQNSGLGNAVNPLVSLAHREVYGLPLILIIGWRGEPGVTDEPQHQVQGAITPSLLDCLGIKYAVLSPEQADAERAVRVAAEHVAKESEPYALLVQKGTFAPYEVMPAKASSYTLTREAALLKLLDHLPEEAVLVATTGMLSRELFEIREARGQSHRHDFLTVGGMGQASSIALGIAREKSDRSVFCLDGDGALIMQTGALAIIGATGPTNFKHVVFNNGAHDSVGGQPTAGFQIDIPAIATGCGYRHAWRTDTETNLCDLTSTLAKTAGPALLEIRLACGARPDLGRPTSSPGDNKSAFMKNLR